MTIKIRLPLAPTAAVLPAGFFKFIYLLLADWVFAAARGLSLVVASGKYSLAAVCRLLVAVASLVAEHRLQGTGSTAAVHRRRRIDAFELWCWRRLLRIPWIARRSNQSILKEISPEYSLERLILKLKLQYFGHLT